MKRIAEFVCGVSALILVNACTTNLSLVDPAGFVGKMAASLYNPANGITLEVYTDQPGLQLYSGQWLDSSETGKCGRRMERYSSFTFETQNYPDAPNKPSFPDPFLHPGEQYTHMCEYRFSVVSR